MAFFLAFTVAAAAMMWPWPLTMNRTGIPAPDFIGNVWVLEQNLHNWTTAGIGATESNAYWPHENTFAYNEALFAQSLEYVTFRGAGASPLLAHNLTHFLTFPLSALGAALLAFELWPTRWGAFLAGLAFSFSSYRWDQFIHLQSQSLQWLPLMIRSMLLYQRLGQRRSLVGVFIYAFLLATSSGYSAVICAICGGVLLLFFLATPESRKAGVSTAATLALAALAVYALFAPYRHAQAAMGMQRGDEVIDWSARFNSFLKPSDYGFWPHLAWLRSQATTHKALFAGTVPLLLAAWGLMKLRGLEGAKLMAAVGGVSLLAALGPEIHIFSLSFPGPFALMREAPVIGMLRTPSRLSAGTLLAIAVFAGGALSLMSARKRRVIAPILCGLLLLETWPRRLGPDLAREIPKAPPTSALLKTLPRGPVMELPWTDEDNSAIYLYWSIEHWQPMFNGWGSFQPRGNMGVGFVGYRWPTPYTSRVYRRVGIRYVVVHAQDFPPDRKARLRPSELPQGVRLLGDFGDDMIWEIDREGPVEETVPGWPPRAYALVDAGLKRLEEEAKRTGPNPGK